VAPPRKPRKLCPACRVNRVKAPRFKTCSWSCAMKQRHARTPALERHAHMRRLRERQLASYLARMASYFRTELRNFEASTDPAWKVSLLAKVYQQGRKDEHAKQFYYRKRNAA
jgi:hypothetical protein